MYDYSKLRGRLAEKFGIGYQKKFAEVVGVTEHTISRKLSGKMSITTQDIENWSRPELLDIKPVEYPEFYFKKKKEA